MRLPSSYASLPCLLLLGCTSAPAAILHPVAPRSPAKESTKATASAGSEADAHAAALEQLAVAPYAMRTDRQHSVRLPLPDTTSWRRVRFLGIKSLVGFRYGTDHHAVAGGFILDVKNRTPESCQAAFEAWAKPWLEVFDVRIELGKPVGFTWRNTLKPTEPPEVLSAVTLQAGTSSLMAQEKYQATYAIYPAWPDKCLVVGMATASRGEDARAKKARDRFAEEVFSKLEITSETAPTKAY